MLCLFDSSFKYYYFVDANGEEPFIRLALRLSGAERAG
jgi:hypothetical protein